ncbi:MAG: hypothetical protein IRZ08_20720 [Frankia sp.]|nr:hypothetical protein [Frankia sp.]
MAVPAALATSAAAATCAAVVLAGPGAANAQNSGSPLTLTTTASPDGYTAAGQTLTFSYVVTNVGSRILYHVAVVEELTGASPVSCPAEQLAPGASMTCQATYVTNAEDVTVGNVTNYATASGIPESVGYPVFSPPSSITVPDPQAAGSPLAAAPTSPGPDGQGGASPGPDGSGSASTPPGPSSGSGPVPTAGTDGPNTVAAPGGSPAQAAGPAPAGGTVPAGGTPAGGTPAGGTVPAGGSVPAGGTPAGGTPAGGAPAGGSPSGGAPAGGGPAGGGPAAGGAPGTGGIGPAGTSPLGDTPVQVTG